MSKLAIANTPGYSFHSSWRVLGLGLACLVASMVVIAVPLMALEFMGIVHL